MQRVNFKVSKLKIKLKKKAGIKLGYPAQEHQPANLTMPRYSFTSTWDQNTPKKLQESVNIE